MEKKEITISNSEDLYISDEYNLNGFRKGEKITRKALADIGFTEERLSVMKEKGILRKV